MVILGIESSCDETAVAVVETHGNASVRVLSNIVSSQIEIHKQYGGVVPEVAAREHVLNILPVAEEALAIARTRTGAEKFSVSPRVVRISPRIDAVAVTVGPGLVTSLIVGVETARSLAYAWDIPVIAVNHIEGHIYANWIGVNSKFQIPNLAYRQTGSKQIQNSKSQIKNESALLAKGGRGIKKSSMSVTPLTPLSKGGEIEFPILILTVSGGHNLLVLMRGHGKYKIIGETLDDAAGEAFDKAAAMLEIGYPGGPAISAEAEKYKIPLTPPKSSDGINFSKGGKIQLPRPMMDKGGYDFSFSGLKTALLYQIQKNSGWKKRIPEYAHEFQQAVIDVLIHKTIKAAKEFKVKTIMLSGGVSANKELRRQMEEAVNIQVPSSKFQVPNLEYTTDNAVMVAMAGYFKALRKEYTPWQKLRVDPNLELK